MNWSKWPKQVSEKQVPQHNTKVYEKNLDSVQY